jgi:hypothetical protein
MKLETIYILQHKYGNKNWEDEPCPQYTLLSSARTTIAWRNEMNELGALSSKGEKVKFRITQRTRGYKVVK